jgi:protein-disulfide isomerase
LLKRDGKIRIVYKEWPILGPPSVYASRAAIASRMQNADKYVSFHNALMESRQITRDTVMAIAASIGLDTKQLERDMKSPDVEAIIKRNYELAQALKLNGTPSFIVGGTLLRGARDLDTLQQIVKDERGKS